MSLIGMWDHGSWGSIMVFNCQSVCCAENLVNSFLEDDEPVGGYSFVED